MKLCLREVPGQHFFAAAILTGASAASPADGDAREQGGYFTIETNSEREGGHIAGPLCL